MDFIRPIPAKTKEMKVFGSGRRLRAVVVGDNDDFVIFVKNLLDVFGIEYLICADVYFAISEIASNGWHEFLVFGRLENLGVEGLRFFDKCHEIGARCCCLVHGSIMGREKEVVAVTQGGGYVAIEQAQVEEVLKSWVSQSVKLKLQQKAKEQKKPAFMKEEFLTTKAELDALLGS